MTYSGHVENGVIVLDELPTALPEGTKVRVELVASDQPSAPSQERPTLSEQFKGLIGKAEGLPVDMAENHDHYIHGTPKNE